jgi:hypothetical protein
MGTEDDAAAVVDGKLQVSEVERLRVVGGNIDAWSS